MVHNNTPVIVEKGQHRKCWGPETIFLKRHGIHHALLLCILIIVLCPGISLADQAAENASGKITVTDVVMSPEILITGDVGLVTFTVKNTGTSNVVISDAQLISKDINVLNNEIYLSSRTIGGGNSMDFSFTILADKPEGIYYPAFYLNYRDAGSLRFNVPVRIEAPELSLSAIQLPDFFIPGVKNTVTLLIGNPKSVDMTGITIIPHGEGVLINQTSYFVGNLGPHNSTRIAFEVTPSVPTNFSFEVNYTCGMNSHQTSFTIPLKFGLDKLAADPVISNLQITYDSSGRKLTGDISNAGLKDAYGVTVTLQDDTQGDSPNLNYVVGALQSDDFASFEILLPRTVGSQATLLLQHKDSSGNPYTKTVSVNLDQVPSGQRTSSGSSGTGSSSSSGAAAGGGGFGGGGPGGAARNPLGSLGQGVNRLPVTEIAIAIIVIAAAVIVWIAWRRRKKGGKIRIKMT